MKVKLTSPSNKKTNDKQIWNCENSEIICPLPPNNDKFHSKGYKNVTPSQLLKREFGRSDNVSFQCS